MSKIPGIYILGDLDTGMSYVGSASHLPKRINEHGYALKRGDHGNWRLQKAFNSGNQIVTIPIPTKPGVDILEIEQTLLDEYYPTGQLYNIMKDVSPTLVGIKRTEETKRRIGEASARKFEDPNYRESHSEKIKLHLSDPINRERMIERVTAATTTPEHREKMAVIANKQWADPEARARKAEAVRERYLTNPEDRQKRIDARAHLGKPVSVDGTVYPSLGMAARAVGTYSSHVRAKVKSKNQPGWFYVEKETHD